MLPTTKEWVDKAESDYATIYLLVRAARTMPLWEPICFHAQQCIEKYLKGRLTEGGTYFPKTHALDELLNRAATIEPTWGGHGGPLPGMNVWAVSIRYPGPTATRADAAHAARVCRTWRARVRASLGL